MNFEVWAQCTVVELSSYPNRTTVAVPSSERLKATQGSRCFNVFFFVGSLSPIHKSNARAMLRLELGQFLRWHLQRCFAHVHTLDLDSADFFQENLQNIAWPSMTSFQRYINYVLCYPSKMSSVTSHEES